MGTYDLIVIGAGPGGYIAAERAGMLGKKVLLIEKEHLGGVCTNWGCIPTKSLLNSAKLYHHAKDSHKHGVDASSVTFSIQKAMEWKQETIETLRSGISFLMKKAQVDVVFGTAECIDNTHVRVGEEVYEGNYLIIATGSTPVKPPIEGVTLPHVVTSNEILTLDTLPKQLVVVGGGVIGIEFASFFSTIGVTVTVIEMMDEIIPLMDGEFAKLLRRELRDVTFHLGCTVTKIDAQSVTFVDKKGTTKEVPSDLVLMSVGRRPLLEGLEKLPLTIGKTGLVTSDNLRTNIPNIYAIGDVNGKSLLAHSASRMAEVVVDNLFGTKKEIMRYGAIPWAVYSMPEASGCGLTEKEAKDKGIEILTATTQMRSNGRFLAEHGKRAAGICKVIADAKSKVILGVHLLGPYSSEMIYGAAAIIESQLRIQDVKEIVFPHPSVSEVIKDTVIAIHETL